MIRFTSLLAICLFFCTALDLCAGVFYVVTRESSGKHVCPHAGIVVVYDDGSVSWLHFGYTDIKDTGRVTLGKAVEGDIRVSSFSVNHLVGFELDDEKLRSIVNSLSVKYSKKDYQLLKCDCVSLATDFCREAGLKVKDEHLAPYSLWKYVLDNNKSVTHKKNVDRDNTYILPWEKK